MKEACEGGDVVEARVLKPTVGGDGMSPHQIPHTEIIESLVGGEAGHSTLKDKLRGGIWFTAVPAIVPGAGGASPNIGIGVNAMRVADVRRVILRDVRIVVLIVASILGRVGRHLLVLLVSDEGDDGIVPPKPPSLI